MAIFFVKLTLETPAEINNPELYKAKTKIFVSYVLIKGQILSLRLPRSTYKISIFTSWVIQEARESAQHKQVLVPTHLSCMCLSF